MGIHKLASKRKRKFAKKLRRRLTRAEREFWSICQKLREEEGIHFWRQIVLCGYVADFWCPKLKLVVEIDGKSHLTEDQIAYDKHREDVMYNELGATTLRFSNFEVINKRAAVEYRLLREIRRVQDA